MVYFYTHIHINIDIDYIILYSIIYLYILNILNASYVVNVMSFVQFVAVLCWGTATWRRLEMLPAMATMENLRIVHKMMMEIYTCRLSSD